VSASASVPLGFESPSSWNISAAADQAERALVSGCSLVMGRSGKYFTKVYERIDDVKPEEEGPDAETETETVVGHRLQLEGQRRAPAPAPAPPGDGGAAGHVDRWRSELSEIQDCFTGSRKLDFITVPFSELCDRSDLVKYDYETLENVAFDKLDSLRDKLGISAATGIGVELSTEYLHGLAPAPAEADADTAIADALADRIAGVVKTLHLRGGLRLLLLPINCYTHGSARKVLERCRELQGLPGTALRQKLAAPPAAPPGGAAAAPSLAVLAVDLYRAHPRRPGLFCCEDVSTLALLPAAVTELKRTLDSCMAVEKKYMETIHNDKREGAASLQALCLGHVLAAQFLAPNSSAAVRLLEEWEYLKEMQVAGRQAAAFDAVREHNKKARDWLLLYQPMSRVVVSRLEEFLQVQQLDMHAHVAEVVSKVLQAHVAAPPPGAVEAQDEILKVLQTHFSSLDMICTSGTRRLEALPWAGGAARVAAGAGGAEDKCLQPEVLYGGIRSALSQYYEDVNTHV
jgi:hypothetical protein